MHLQPSLAFLAALPLATPATAPADSEPGIVTPDEILSSVPEAAPAPARGVLAVMRQDALPDLFGVQQGVLTRSYEPGLFDSTQAVAYGVLDIALAAGRGEHPGTDGIATVGPAGIHLWVEGSDNLVPRPVDLGYGEGRQVRCADVLGDGAVDIVVLDESQSALRVYSGGPEWNLAGTLTFPHLTILDFDLGRFESTHPGADLVLAVEDGVHTYVLTPPAAGSNQFGAALTFFRQSWAYAQNQVETLRDHVAVGVDGFAWACYVTPLDQWALSAGYVGYLGEQTALLLPEDKDVLALSAGRLDYHPLQGPGSEWPNRDDVALSFEEEEEVYFFINRGPLQAKAFDSEPLDGANYSGSLQIPHASKALGEPVLGDLDGNLVGEVLLGLEPPSGAGQELWLGYDVSSDVSLELEAGAPESGFARPTFQFRLEPWDPNLASSFSPDWFVTDGAADTTIQAALETNQQLSGIRLALWIQSSAMEPFDPLGTATCETSYAGPPPTGLQQLAAYVRQNALPGPDRLFSSGQRVVAMQARAIQPLTDGSQPALWLAMQGVDENEGALAWNANGFLQVTPGAQPSRLERTAPEGSTGEDSDSRGVGIVVESFPPRRIVPPPGGPRPGPTNCPSGN